MALNKLFDTIDEAKNTATWQSAFGEPQEVEGQTIIPVAQVGYGFGLGFGQGPAPAGEDTGSESTGGGGGVGGATWSKPLGVMVVTEEQVYFEEAVDATKIALVGILAATLTVFQFAKTLRAVFGRN